MRWYRLSSTPRLAKAMPPAYLVERVSDLKYALGLASQSPRASRAALLEVAASFDKHHEDLYSKPIRDAAQIVLDSPVRANEVVTHVIEVMMNEKEELRLEQEAKERGYRNKSRA